MKLKCWLKGHDWEANICFPYRGWFMHLLECKRCPEKTWWLSDKKISKYYKKGDIEHYLKAIYTLDLDPIITQIMLSHFGAIDLYQIKLNFALHVNPKNYQAIKDNPLMKACFGEHIYEAKDMDGAWCVTQIGNKPSGE